MVDDSEADDDPQSSRSRFWEKPLDELSTAQWESLCDGCGRCCLQKLSDADTGEIFFTRLSCRELDIASCRCRHYRQRFERVPDCTSVHPLTSEKLHWLPPTCAYRLVATGRPLPDWHPLISGDPDSVHHHGISVRVLAVSEDGIDEHDYPEYIISFDAGQR